jgi:alpha-L-fucosidase
MNRRTFLSSSVKAGVLATIPSIALQRGFAVAVSHAINGTQARPTTDQLRWQDMEIGAFVHFGNETYQNGRSHDFSVPASEVNPVDLDTDQWARTAVAMGAKYIVFVAKHQYGFCCWQTKTTDFSLKSSPWKNGHGDIMRDLAISCQKFGLGLGIYLSPRDNHFGAATGGICKTPAEQAKYDTIYRQQLTELLSLYGPITEIWFDGATATPVGDLIEKYQPHAAVFQGPQATIRWIGNEDGFAPYPCWNGIDKIDTIHGTATALDSNPDGDVWLPSEVDVSIRRPDWFWTPQNANKTLTVDQLLSIYYRSVGRGAQLLLNIPPNPRGLFDTCDVTAATGFGSEIARRFGRPIAGTSGKGMRIEVKLPRTQKIDTMVLEEDITQGERIREYLLKGRTQGKWQVIGEGTAVGHKRIQPLRPITVDAVCLEIRKAVAMPVIRSLAVFDTGVEPPADWNAPTSMWAPDLAGSWHDYRFQVDLRKSVHEAAQYRLRFVASRGHVTGFKQVVLILEGVPQPKLLKIVSGKPNELILDITGLGDTGTISGIVLGAASGQILLGKM